MVENLAEAVDRSQCSSRFKVQCSIQRKGIVPKVPAVAIVPNVTDVSSGTCCPHVFDECPAALTLFFIEGLGERLDASCGQVGAAAPTPGGITLEFLEAAVTFLEVRGAFDEQAAYKTHNAGDQ